MLSIWAASEANSEDSDNTLILSGSQRCTAVKHFRRLNLKVPKQ
jgi:hypothetical protein